jgi:hypothetical protein
VGAGRPAAVGISAGVASFPRQRDRGIDVGALGAEIERVIRSVMREDVDNVLVRKRLGPMF